MPNKLKKRFSPSPFTCLKNSDRRASFRKGTSAYSPQHIGTKCGRQGGPKQVCLLDSPVHHCFWVARQEFVSQMFAVSRIVYFPFEVPDPCLLLFTAEWHISLNCTILPQVHIFMMSLCVYHNKFGHFLPLICNVLIWLLV